MKPIAMHLCERGFQQALTRCIRLTTRVQAATLCAGCCPGDGRYCSLTRTAAGWAGVANTGEIIIRCMRGEGLR